MIYLVVALLLLASASIGLRLTAFFVSERLHPLVRLMVALVTGALVTAAVLQAFSQYHVFEFGVGLLLSLSPVGVYDLAKWWFRSRRRH